jgi:hypothetical protein
MLPSRRSSVDATVFRATVFRQTVDDDQPQMAAATLADEESAAFALAGTTLGAVAVA